MAERAAQFVVARRRGPGDDVTPRGRNVVSIVFSVDTSAAGFDTARRPVHDVGTEQRPLSAWHGTC